ncbi:MAG TPA: hypothetical protein VFJ62_00480 [Usitatibacter sp.]|nr:hypothetical protein [Usitatibacter sp.]
MEMHQLEAAVLAAGMATAYIADDWAAEPAAPATEVADAPGAPTQH